MCEICKVIKKKKYQVIIVHIFGTFDFADQNSWMAYDYEFIYIKREANLCPLSAC